MSELLRDRYADARKALRKDLTVRTANCLLNEGCESLEDACRFSRRDLLRVPNFGRKSLNELVETLAARGLKLADDNPPSRGELLARALGRLHATKAAHERAQRELDKLLSE